MVALLIITYNMKSTYMLIDRRLNKKLWLINRFNEKKSLCQEKKEEILLWGDK